MTRPARGWRAIVPLKPLAQAKTRLAAQLSPDERRGLVQAMARHVIGTLNRAHVDEVAVLSPEPAGFIAADWIEDRGRGLNAELAAALGGGRTLIVHADLPLLAGDDIAALLAAAEDCAAALAPDRSGTGTNALAVSGGGPFTPCFGAGSLARHCSLLPQAALIQRPGLALDVDTADDLAVARAAPGSCIADPIWRRAIDLANPRPQPASVEDAA